MPYQPPGDQAKEANYPAADGLLDDVPTRVVDPLTAPTRAVRRPSEGLITGITGQPATARWPMQVPTPPSRVPAQNTTANMPLVIPGTRYPARVVLARREPRRRPIATHITVALLALCVIITTTIAGTILSGPNGIMGPSGILAAFAVNNGVPATTEFTLYKVQTGDTPESIGKTFNVTIGGIYKLNHLYLGDELTTGQSLKIPANPSYGGDYRPTTHPIPPAPPAPPQPAFGGAPPGTVFGTCVFCSYAGATTGSGPCAPAASTNLGFGLIQPDPNGHWVRGFTWYHNGVDISTGRLGTPLVAAQDGQVIFSGWDVYGGGYSVKINHCHGLATSYGHMQAIYVRTGQFVHKGQVLGQQGSTGNSTGPHVHFMVWWNNQYQDPLHFYTHLGFPYP